MYKRVLLKLSGERLAGPSGKGLDPQTLMGFASRIAALASKGHQIAIVNGGGNIFRGLTGEGLGFDRVTGDRMGMLATVINSLALQSAFKNLGVKAEVFTATPMEPLARYYNRDNAVRLLEEGGIALLSGGTGNPYFSTDSGAALRALEIGADAIFKGTSVDGVYTADPHKDPSAVRYDELTFEEAYGKGLRIMDKTAFALCQDGRMPVVVFDISSPTALEEVFAGGKAGTLIHV